MARLKHGRRSAVAMAERKQRAAAGRQVQAKIRCLAEALLSRQRLCLKTPASLGFAPGIVFLRDDLDF
jgi:hypothetical protein